VPGIQLPQLSEYDPAISAEGGLDPLGLYAIADSLAVKLVPGVRERMLHPRYLTAMAVGNVFTRLYDDDDVAADGHSEPYLVYEWHVVEGIIRTRRDDPELKRLPGSLKVKECLRDHVRISAARYLKTATVFGFHGVYRPFADNLDIVKNNLLGENGYELLTAWEKEQELNGFVNGNNGNGLAVRQQLEVAIQDAMKKGAVSRSGGWNGWGFFGRHLFPNRIPPRERDCLKRFLLSEMDSSRAQVLRFLISDKGRSIFGDSNSEEEFHQALLPHVDEDTRHLIDTIVLYEKFSRLLQDAFDDCLEAMTKKKGPISPDELAQTPGCHKAYRKIPNIFTKLGDHLEPFGETVRYLESFGEMGESTSPESWVNILIDHHIKIQRQKPPHGKRPWFEKFDDGSVVVRARYRRNNGGQHDDAYVHAYRTNSLWSFASDLELSG